MDRQLSPHPFRSVCTIGLLSVCLLALVLVNLSAPRRVIPSSVESHPATVTMPHPPVLEPESTAHKAKQVSVQLPAISSPHTGDRSASARLLESYGKLPLSFEQNQGQTDAQVKFLSRGKGYTMFLTAEGAVMTLRASDKKSTKPEGGREPLSGKRERSIGSSSAVLRMKLVGANREAIVEGGEELPGKSNYFLGNDPSQWRVDVPNYSRVKYESVYPGVDLVYYGNQGQLESDFIVGAGADVGAIRLRIEGSRGMRINREGDLELDMDGGEVVLGKPVVYQRNGGEREKHVIAGRYTIQGKHQVGFEVASYDKSEPLIIDPVLRYSTYLGGSGDDAGYGIAVDGEGNAYATGSTNSLDFPTSMIGLQAGNFDAFVTKLNAAGNALVYSTYLGGSGDDSGNGIAVDGAGNAYMTGSTYSTNFPTTETAFQFTFGGIEDAFVTKLNAAGNALLYSTYLGGSGDDSGNGIAVDGADNAYVTGSTSSTDFPTMTAFQATSGGDADAFVTILNPSGNALVYSTYLGGSGYDAGYSIAADAGNAYVTGYTYSTDFPTVGAFQSTFGGGKSDAFVTKLHVVGKTLVYIPPISTYLGGSGDDAGYGIAVDGEGNAYVTGKTTSTDFPTMNAFQSNYGGGVGDAFVTKLNVSGNALAYSTYLGGSGYDGGDGIAVDGRGNAYVTGFTYSTNFPTANAYQATSGGNYDAFITKLNSAGSGLVYSTYLGGSGEDVGYGIAVNAAGNVYVTGSTTSSNFPTVNAFQSSYGGGAEDAFVAKISFPAALGDFDADGKADIAVWRPSQGTWFVIPSSGNPSQNITQQWGTAGDIPVPGDYDGDGKIDFAVWRPSNGTWFIIPSSNPSSPIITQFGTTLNGVQDVPVQGDYDGDGITDIAVWRPSNGTWFIIPSSNPSSPIIIQWGATVSGVQDVPVPGDYDGDGKTDLAVWRPSSGTWYIIPSGDPKTSIITQWGGTVSGVQDLPVPGDYDGDGKTDLAVWRPSEGNWYIIPSSNPHGAIITQWGATLYGVRDVPVPGDYDGDGKTDLAVWRPSNGTWYVIRSSAPSTYITAQWGVATDIPIQQPIGQPYLAESASKFDY